MKLKSAAFVGILILSASLNVLGNASNALANTGPCGDDNFSAAVFCSALLITLSPIASSTGLVESTSGDNREMMVGQIREDSAEFVASDGLETPSAFLTDAFQSVRANTPAAKNMTDLQIAEILVSAQD